MREAILLIVWSTVFAAIGGVIAWRTGRLVEARWPVVSIPSFIALGLVALFLSWTAAVHVVGTTQPGCEEIFEGTDKLDGPSRSEFVARCIVTAGADRSLSPMRRAGSPRAD
jgi:hypothetical protein